MLSPDELLSLKPFCCPFSGTERSTYPTQYKSAALKDALHRRLLLVFYMQMYVKGLAEHWKMMPEEDKEVAPRVC